MELYYRKTTRWISIGSLLWVTCGHNTIDWTHYALQLPGNERKTFQHSQRQAKKFENFRFSIITKSDNITTFSSNVLTKLKKCFKWLFLCFAVSYLILQLPSNLAYSKQNEAGESNIPWLYFIWATQHDAKQQEIHTWKQQI